MKNESYSVGQTGAGKSSFVNTVATAFDNHVVRKTDTGSTMGSLSRQLQLYEIEDNSDDKNKNRAKKNKLKVRFYDTMGIEVESESGLSPAKISQIMDGAVELGADLAEDEPQTRDPNPDDQTHCLVFVVNESFISSDENIVKKFRDIRNIANKKGDFWCGNTYLY